MALLWADGFTASYHNGPLTRKYTGSNTSWLAASFVTDPYNTGLNVPLNTSVSALHTPDLLVSPATTIICAADLKVGSENMSSYANNGFAFHNSAGRQLTVELEQVANFEGFKTDLECMGKKDDFAVRVMNERVFRFMHRV